MDYVSLVCSAEFVGSWSAFGLLLRGQKLLNGLRTEDVSRGVPLVPNIVRLPRDSWFNMESASRSN